jgi:hypothetical protein
MGRAEGAVQSYVIQRLELLERTGKCYHFRNNSFTGRVTRYNGSQGYVKNGKPGMPDIIAVFRDGIFTGIEVKSATGRQSPEQKRAQSQIEALGGRYWLVRTPEELETNLIDLI